MEALENIRKTNEHQHKQNQESKETNMKANDQFTAEKNKEAVAFVEKRVKVMTYLVVGLGLTCFTGSFH